RETVQSVSPRDPRKVVAERYHPWLACFCSGRDRQRDRAAQDVPYLGRSMTVRSIALLGRSVAVMSFLLAPIVTGFPLLTLAAVGDAVITAITPTAVSPFVSPAYGLHGGTSLTVVQGSL